MSRIYSQIPYVDWDDPDAYGRDDYNGLPVMHRDLVKQMQWGPQGLYWTGFMVHYERYNEPNPQLVPPRLKPDPVPIWNPRILARPPLPQIPTDLTLVSTTSSTASLTWDAVYYDTSYVITAASTYNTITATVTVPVTFPYTLTGLSSGVSYLVQIASTDDNGTSAFSQPILVIPT